MKNILTLCLAVSFLSSCTVYLTDDTPHPKSAMEKLEDFCQQGDKKACDVLDLKQKQVEEENMRRIKESGVRDKGKR